VQLGLQKFGGGKLPMVDGFVTSAVTELDRYDRPYYQYRVHLQSADDNSTLISVEAKISAWYADPDPARAEYRALPSNGRLESVLLDRLQEALRGPGATPSSGAPAAAIRTPASSPDPSSTSSPSSPKSAAPVKTASASQAQLDAILAERQAVRERTAACKPRSSS
jgi:hypothetical protein